jgi:predicted nucleotidyltransferase
MVAAIEAPAREAIQQRYEEALATFVARVRQDRQILAAILFGSLSYDEVWERSDIDLWLIARDDPKGRMPGPG